MNRRIKCKIAKRIIVFNQTAHKALWTWLAEKGSKLIPMSAMMLKTKWPGWERNGGDIPHAAHCCMACQYAYTIRKKSKRYYDVPCRYYPLSVRGNTSNSNCLSGLYIEWEEAVEWNYVEEAQKIALKIANLPIKKYVKTI